MVGIRRLAAWPGRMRATLPVNALGSFPAPVRSVTLRPHRRSPARGVCLSSSQLESKAARAEAVLRVSPWLEAPAHSATERAGDRRGTRVRGRRRALWFVPRAASRFVIRTAGRRGARCSCHCLDSHPRIRGVSMSCSAMRRHSTRDVADPRRRWAVAARVRGIGYKLALKPVYEQLGKPRRRRCGWDRRPQG